MAFTDDWDSSFEALPADNDSRREGADRIRDHKLAIRERMAVDHAFDDIGSNVATGYHNHVTLDQAVPSDPPAGYNRLYASATRLLYKITSTIKELVTTDDTQTLTNKTLTSPIITSLTTDSLTVTESALNDITVTPTNVTGWSTTYCVASKYKLGSQWFVKLFIKGTWTSGPSSIYWIGLTFSDFVFDEITSGQSKWGQCAVKIYNGSTYEYDAHYFATAGDSLLSVVVRQGNTSGGAYLIIEGDFPVESEPSF